MRGKLTNYSTVNGHAPTEISDDEEKTDEFFDALERAYDVSPINYVRTSKSFHTFLSVGYW